MWKTRFEMSNNYNNGLMRHRNHPSTSTIYHRYYSRRLPTVPRVRDDSPNAILRPSRRSSIPNLDILIEEDEDNQYTNLTTNEQTNFILPLPKQNSSQILNKYQFVLPTIIESNDNEILNDNEQMKANQIINDDKQTEYHIKFKQQDSFVTNNHAMNTIIERKDRLLNTNTNNQTIELTIDKRINELLQQQNERQNKSICCSSTDFDTREIIRSNTFKDISAFFENKAIAAATLNLFEQKKRIRAKRSLALNRSMPINNDDLTKLEFVSKIEKEANVFYHQIKRIKTTHKVEIDSIEKQEMLINDKMVKGSKDFDPSMNKIESKEFLKSIKKICLKKLLTNRWFNFVLFINVIIIVIFYLTNIYPNLFHISVQNSPLYVSSEQPNKPIPFINNNFIFRYAQFIQNLFFSSVDTLMTLIGQLFFHIDKYDIFE